MQHAVHSVMVTRGAMIKWSLMAFIAGSINAGGFMACQRFVSHVTGFATLFGVGVATQDMVGALSMLSVPGFFLVGAMVSAYFTDARLLRGRRARFGLVMVLVALLLLLAAILGHFQIFGQFGRDYQEDQDFILLSLLCGASGLQNAAVTTGSRSLMRATHLTGMTTDLGIGIVRVLFGSDDRTVRLAEFYVMFVRMCIVLAFCFGSVIGAFLFISYGYLGFLMPTFLALVCGALGFWIFVYHLDASR